MLFHEIWLLLDEKKRSSCYFSAISIHAPWYDFEIFFQHVANRNSREKWENEHTRARQKILPLCKTCRFCNHLYLLMNFNREIMRNCLQTDDEYTFELYARKLQLLTKPLICSGTGNSNITKINSIKDEMISFEVDRTKWLQQTEKSNSCDTISLCVKCPKTSVVFSLKLMELACVSQVKCGRLQLLKWTAVVTNKMFELFTKCYTLFVMIFHGWIAPAVTPAIFLLIVHLCVHRWNLWHIRMNCANFMHWRFENVQCLR